MRPRRLRSARVRGGALVAALAVVTGPFLGTVAAQAATSETASTGGYFSVTGPVDTGTPAGSLPNVGTNVDGVAEGNLAVSAAGGQEQKISFLAFAGEGLEPGARVRTATLSVPLATGSGNVAVAPTPDKVRVCLAGSEGFGGEDGASLTVAPSRLCDAFSAVATASSDGASYVFDVTGLAQLWTEANDGLALTAVAGAPAFQVVFGPADQARLTYDVAPAAATPGATPSPGATPVVTAGPGAPEGGGTAVLPGGDLLSPDDLTGGPTDGGLSGVVALPGTDGTATDTSAEAPQVAAGPTVDEPQVAVGGAAPAAFQDDVAGEPSLTPGVTFWVGLAALAGLLALASLVLGDTEVPPPHRSTSRLSLALQAQSQPGAPASRRQGLGS